MGNTYSGITRRYPDAGYQNNKQSEKEQFTFPEVRIGRYVLDEAVGAEPSFHEYMQEVANLNEDNSLVQEVSQYRFFVPFINEDKFTEMVLLNNREDGAISMRRALYEHNNARKSISHLFQTALLHDESLAMRKMEVLQEMEIEPDEEWFYHPNDPSAHMNWGERVVSLRSQAMLVGSHTLAFSVRIDRNLETAHQDARALIKTAGFGSGLMRARPDTTMHIEAMTLHKPFSEIPPEQAPVVPEPPKLIKLGPLILE